MGQGILILGYSFIIICCTQISSQSYDNMTNLISTVLTGYNNYVRPLSDQSEAIQVNLSIIIYNILEVDTVKGILSIAATLSNSWTDERVTWNPADYAGITSLKIPQKYVWTPPVASIQSVQVDRLGEDWITVTYQSDGKASWNPSGVHKISCLMNVKHWPYDRQVCKIDYFLYDYPDTEAILTPGNVATNFYKENGEWTLESMQIGTIKRFRFTEIVFTTIINRKSSFYTVTLIIPLSVLSLLSSFVFLLPSESGERVGYCTTVLLSMTVFLHLISDEIPKLSNPLPAISQFLFVGVMTSGVITVVVILNQILFHRSEQVPIPNYYRAIVRVVCHRTNKIQTYQQQYQDTKEQHEATARIDQIPATSLKTEAFLATSNTGTSKTKLAANASTGKTDMTWSEVSQAIDKICFVLFTTASVVGTTIMILVLRLNL